MNNNQLKRLFDLNKRAKSCEPFTSEEIGERNDLQFLRNKENVNLEDTMRTILTAFILLVPLITEQVSKLV